MKILYLVLLFSVSERGFGLRCWTCKQVATNNECIIKGSIETCGPDEACVNQETTIREDSKYEITKGCRRSNADACLSNDQRNPGNYPTVCKQSRKTNVCSCCCNTDLCNGPQVECKDMKTCRNPDKPGNGKIRCESPITYGSTCTIICDRGYRRVGAKKITCSNGTNEGYWNPRQSAACVAISAQQPQRKQRRCKLMQAPEHGSMICENQGRYKDDSSSNYVGTKCAFKCNPGHFRDGPEINQCLGGGRWNIPPPKCLKGMCRTPPQDQHRIDTCSDGNYFGSICDIQCETGYMLVGSSSITCRAVNEFVRQGAWSSEFPRCVRAVCHRQLKKPVNGEMSCTRGNTMGSVCTFSCRRGFQLTDVNNAVECARNGNVAQWNGQSPRCIRLKCPRVEMPENGNVMCRGGRRIGTKCTFNCNTGYAMVGNSKFTLTSQCRLTRSAQGVQEAKMSVEKVECAEIHCQLEKMASPLNGQVFCSRGNFHGSRCIFSCNPGYDMDGTADRAMTSVCEYNVTDNGMGKWSASPPTCSRLYCPVRQNDPINGEVTCTDGSFMGSVCEFKCNDGYELVGPVAIICRDLAYDGDAEIEWSDNPPVCISSTCPELWYDKTTMRATCNRKKEGNGYPVGTKCVYECADFRYYLQTSSGDTSDVTCLAKNQWSVSAAPRCFLKTCSRLPQIENGNEPICTLGKLVSSVCTFKCNTKYSLSHNDAITCESTGRQDKIGRWDFNPPKCIPSECERVPTTPRRGIVDCSNGAKLGSICTLTCDPGYNPKTVEVTCQMTTQSVKGKMVSAPRFGNEQNFCCAECRSDFYITLAVDTRYKRGLQNVVDFARIFLTQLSQRNNQIYFSAFAFNAGVNQSTAIDRIDVMSAENLKTTLARMEKWQVHKEGMVSDSSSALEYANDNSFSPLDPSHANFLIVTAEDAPENVDQELIRRIRSRGIGIIVGVRNEFARIRWGQLLNGDGDVINLDSNKVMNRMNTVAFKNECSTQASKCV